MAETTKAAKPKTQRVKGALEYTPQERAELLKSILALDLTPDQALELGILNSQEAFLCRFTLRERGLARAVVEQDGETVAE